MNLQQCLPVILRWLTVQSIYMKYFEEESYFLFSQASGKHILNELWMKCMKETFHHVEQCQNKIKTFIFKFTTF